MIASSEPGVECGANGAFASSRSENGLNVVRGHTSGMGVSDIVLASPATLVSLPLSTASSILRYAQRAFDSLGDEDIVLKLCVTVRLTASARTSLKDKVRLTFG